MLIFFMSLIIYFFTRWFMGGEKWTILVSLLLFLPATLVFPRIVFLLPVILFVIFFYDRRKKKLKSWLKPSYIIGVAVAAVALLLLVMFIGNTGQSPVNIVVKAFSRYITYLFSPVPWTWENANDVLVFIFYTAFYLLFLAVLPVMYIRTKKEKRFLPGTFMVLFILFSFLSAQESFAPGTVIISRFRGLLFIATIYLVACEGEAFQIASKFKKIRIPVSSYIRGIIGKHLSDKDLISLDYQMVFGKKPDFSNPITYNEKLQWLKLYDRKPIYTELTDKILVRNHIREMFGEEYLFPLYGIYDNYDDIDFENLPNKFVLKPNHTSGDIYMCEDKSKIDRRKLKKMTEKWLKSDYYMVHREWQYKDIERKLMIEEYMQDEEHGHPRNYKFFCFHGKPYMFLISTGYGPTRTNDHFDMDFNMLPIYGYKRYDKEFVKPANFDKLVEMVQEISKLFIQVRVDTYIIGGRIYFGELTLYHYSGLERWSPESYDIDLGSKIMLPSQNVNVL
ncbi:MAG TPA: ATP-grasp fold amidoligase family protein [Clostridia bacterium]|nr:ATP-grasp fold amidoligase family protein [Clostridia bacterium]